LEGVGIKTAVARVTLLAITLGVVALNPPAPSGLQPGGMSLVSSLVVPIAAGERTSLVLTATGTVISWGSNFWGQLGNGNTDTTGCACNPFPMQIPGLNGVTAVVGGYGFNFVLKSDGTLWGFGVNNFGQLGDGTMNNSASPVQVQGIGGVVAATASYGTAYAIESNGTLWAWGKNDAGQVGNGQQVLGGCICVPTPTQVTGISGVMAVAASGENVMALTSDGTVWGWGDNAEGAVGNGSCSTSFLDQISTPYHITSLTGITAIAATTGDSYALASDHTIWDWGSNGRGQLARQGSTCGAATDVPGQIPNFSGVAAIAATKTGGGFASSPTASAILSDGTVWDWGDNSGCQLGDGTDNNSSIPIKVPTLSSIVAIADGFEYSIAEKSDGTLFAWGDNSGGSLGDGTTGPYATNCGDPNARNPFQTQIHGLALGSGGGTTPSFIYVALGDSYSAGEGNPPFEDGTNYPAAVKQENTYTYGPGANSCHRSLNDYAKISAPNLVPGKTTLLVDRTCSGAQIVPPPGFPKGPIVPTPFVTDRTDDQMGQAIAKLNTDFGGLQPTDVNLVSVTMGGNDAGFGGLIQACLIPNILQALFHQYANAPGEVVWLQTHFGSCKFYDQLLFHTTQNIPKVASYNAAAQAKLVQTFPNARVLQPTYPVFVPSSSDFPGDNCGGLLRGDADYARIVGDGINAQIRTAGNFTHNNVSGKFQLVEMENGFGANPLCPSNPRLALINGIDQGTLNSVIGGIAQSGTQSRQLLDNLNSAYKAFRDCVSSLPPPFPIVFCSSQLTSLGAALDALKTYFNAQRISDLVGRLAPPNLPPAPPGMPDEVLHDSSQNLFHPNAAGWSIFACNLTATYQGKSADGCLPTGGRLVYQLNGSTLSTSVPVVVTPGVAAPFVFDGFDPATIVSITGFSTAVSLGSVTVDPSGVASGTFTLPASLNPGVHRVEFQGTNNGSPRTIDVLVQIGGRPRGGDDYGLYFSGFAQDSEVDVNYAGLDWGHQIPDSSGGVFVEVPLPVPAVPTSMSVTVTGLTTGTAVTQAVSPAPRAAAVWAGGGSAASLDVSGSGITITGWAHTDGSLSVDGHGIAVTGGAEYGATAAVTGTGNKVSPAPVQVAPGGEPLTVNIVDWRPGGAMATQLGSQYQAVPASACANGVWTPQPGDITGAVVYVPCGVDITLNGPLAASIVAEGSITIDGRGVQMTGVAADFSLASAAVGPNAIVVNGSGFSAVRAIWSAGNIALLGEAETLSCGAYGASITVTSGGTEIAACVPGQ
jgi:alpha-tubulin suppressor-like RCC1 family protein